MLQVPTNMFFCWGGRLWVRPLACGRPWGGTLEDIWGKPGEQEGRTLSLWATFVSDLVRDFVQHFVRDFVRDFVWI